MKLVLHNYWRSSASHRVRIGLGLKQLPYEYVVVNILHKDQHADAYRARNPMAQVPTLEITEDDGTVESITQSLPILEYLDERWPEPPILPCAPPLHPFGANGDRLIGVLRARCRALAEIINSGIQPLQNLTTTKAVKAFGGDADAWPKPFIANGLAAYERLVREIWKDQPPQYSAGDIPTIADCCLVPQLASARRFGVDVAPYELLLAIEQRCLAMPAFANAAPDRQPDAIK
jgi:maleylpyruvate isomerase